MPTVALPLDMEMLPELPVPGELTVAPAPSGRFDTLAFSEAVEPDLVTVIPTLAAAWLGKAAIVALAS